MTGISGTFFTYGSHIDLQYENTTAPHFNNVPISQTVFASAFIASQYVNVTLTNSLVQTISRTSIRITLTDGEFADLIRQLHVYLSPYVPLEFQYGPELMSLPLKTYCLYLYLLWEILVFFKYGFFLYLSQFEQAKQH